MKKLSKNAHSPADMDGIKALPTSHSIRA